MAVPTKDLIAVAEAQPPAETSDLAMQIVSMAANKDIDVAKLEKLIEMQERVTRSQAEAAFNRAFAEMQADLPVISARTQGDKWKYATLEDIVDVVRPILKRFGFSLSHRTEWPDKDTLKVVGILSHVQGHSRQSEFQSTADKSGSKNAIQGLGSANAYGRRYTTTDLLGIATRDDNGHAVARQSEPDQEAPAGYVEWLQKLESSAMQGTKQMMAEWNASKPELRNFLIRSDRKRWEAIKTTAAEVGAKK
jgi:hypothetical protein